jgi:homoserine dehydrogenase
VSAPLVLGLAGFGTVGTGLVRVLDQSSAALMSRAGRPIRIKSILVRDPSRPRAAALPPGTALTTCPEDLTDDAEVDVVVELMGGIDAPRKLIARALANGRHVVTANKALLAESGNELFALAAARGLHLGFEASVCGGIPVVQTLREGLAANRVQELVGILNGTSNYILTEMSSGGMPFRAALARAQELGYAEADPTLDVEGADAAHKLILLIRLAWGLDFPFSALPVHGISGVEAEDIRYARQLGCRIKLLGYARLLHGQDFGMEAGVAPHLVHEACLMAGVNGAYNALRIQGDVAGPVFLHGRGAGALPTGSAVAADILAIARNALPNNTGFVRAPVRAVPAAQSVSPWYIRLRVSDSVGVLRDVAAIMAANGISIAQIIQQDGGDGGAGVPLVVMTHKAGADGVRTALRQLASAPMVHRPPVCFPVLPLFPPGQREAPEKE